MTRLHASVCLDKCTEPSFWTKRSQVVRPALIWCDVRTEEQTRDLTAEIGTARLIELTSNPALTNFTLTKCLCRSGKTEPELWKKVRSVMLPKGLCPIAVDG